MPSEAYRADRTPFASDDRDAEEVLAAHGGDPKAALRDCLDHIARLEMQVSRGFIRLPLAKGNAVDGGKS
ncbi:hypothetical protein ACLBXM_18075 [Xanthobacteraceae bacterium A53D]